MTTSIYRYPLLAIALIGCLSSSAYVCVTAAYYSKSVRIEFQNTSSQLQLQELQKYVQDSCESLAILKAFSPYFQIGPIEFKEETYSPPLFPQSYLRTDRTTCTVSLSYFLPDQVENEVKCSFKNSCPNEFLEKPLEWKKEEDSGGETYSCNIMGQ